MKVKSKDQLYVVLMAIAIICFASFAVADEIPPYNFATPIFGLATEPNGSLLVADFGAGVVELKHGEWNLIAALPTVTDIAPIGSGKMFAVTGLGPGDMAQKLFRVKQNGQVDQIADLLAFETNVNPDGGVIDSNPFDVEKLSGSKALVADAGANDLLIIDKQGNVDWIATLPNELVSSQDLKDLVGCPTPVPGFEFVCGLPSMMPAQPVATGIAIGPDGAYYVSELKGFPAPRNESRIWRIEPDALHAQCGTSPACSVVADGFTSIVDLNFDGDFLYVVEIDEASWAAVEFGIGPIGGTVNRCDVSNWTCVEVATGLQIPIATADHQGNVYAAISALIPGLARIIQLP